MLPTARLRRGRPTGNLTNCSFATITAAETVPRVNPAILRWARETAGLSPADAARKIDLPGTRKATATERIEALEDGRIEPSRPLLLRMSKQYRRPLIAFYLSGPPRKGDRGQDFRSLPSDYAPANEVLLDALLRDIRSRQDLVRAALEDEDGADAVALIGSLDLNVGVAAAVNTVRKTIALPITQFRAAAGAEAAFRLLRERVESLGVYVVLLGDLGSHHSALNLETFRGIAIADAIAPFIVLNDQDSRAAWSFSLIHEITHLLLGQTGVSGSGVSSGVEKFCNDVAAEYLISATELITEFRRAVPTTEGVASWIDDFAKKINVSRTMLAYRLYTNELISRDLLTTLRGTYREQWLASRQKRKEKAKDSTGGPNFYIVRRQRLGDALLATTSRLLEAGALTTSKSARVLGVKPTQVGPLLGIESWATEATE